MTSEYDVRQLNRMLDVLNEYETGQVGLGKAIADLEALLMCLEGLQEAWKKAFRLEWAIMEDVYASMLDKELDRVPSHLQALIDGAVVALQSLVRDTQGSRP